MKHSTCKAVYTVERLFVAYWSIGKIYGFFLSQISVEYDIALNCLRIDTGIPGQQTEQFKYPEESTQAADQWMNEIYSEELSTVDTTKVYSLSTWNERTKVILLWSVRNKTGPFSCSNCNNKVIQLHPSVGALVPNLFSSGCCRVNQGPNSGQLFLHGDPGANLHLQIPQHQYHIEMGFPKIDRTEITWEVWSK